MRVIVSGDLASAGDGLFLPFVRDSQGHVDALARLADPGMLSKVANAAQFWQISSVLLAQKHLADISSKLSAILSRMDQIKNFLEGERKSKITGSLEYLEQLIDCIKAGEIPEGAVQRVESIEISLLSVQNHLTEDFRHLISNIQAYEDTEWFGSRDLFNKLQEYLAELERLNESWALCVRARMLNLRFRSILPLSKALIAPRLSSIRSKEKIMHGEGGLADCISLQIGSKITQINSRFNCQETIDARRNEVRKGLSKVQKFYESLRKSNEEQVLMIGQALDIPQPEIHLEIQIQGGKIIDMKQIC